MAENRESISIKLKETAKGELSALQAEWEAKMAEEGLAPIDKPLTDELGEAGVEADSFDGLATTEYLIKNSLDNGVETENIFPSEIPLNKCGLPPCKRAKLEDERRIVEKDIRLGV